MDRRTEHSYIPLQFSLTRDKNGKRFHPLVCGALQLQLSPSTLPSRSSLHRKKASQYCFALVLEIWSVQQKSVFSELCERRSFWVNKGVQTKDTLLSSLITQCKLINIGSYLIWRISCSGNFDCHLNWQCLMMSSTSNIKMICFMYWWLLNLATFRSQPSQPN